MQSFASLCVLVVILSVVGAAPSIPVFPIQFSATLSVYQIDAVDPPYYGIYRLFLDAKLQKQRLDLAINPQDSGKPGTEVIISDAAGDVGYDVQYFLDNTVTCNNWTGNVILMSYDFSAYQFYGVQLMHFVPVNKWQFNNFTSNLTVIYYEDASSREPVQLETVYNNSENPTTVIWNFEEVDVAPQDPYLFVLPAAVKSVCGPNNS